MGKTLASAWWPLRSSLLSLALLAFLARTRPHLTGGVGQDPDPGLDGLRRQSASTLPALLSVGVTSALVDLRSSADPAWGAGAVWPGATGPGVLMWVAIFALLTWNDESWERSPAAMAPVATAGISKSFPSRDVRTALLLGSTLLLFRVAVFFVAEDFAHFRASVGSIEPHRHARSWIVVVLSLLASSDGARGTVRDLGPWLRRNAPTLRILGVLALLVWQGMGEESRVSAAPGQVLEAASGYHWGGEERTNVPELLLDTAIVVLLLASIRALRRGREGASRSEVLARFQIAAVALLGGVAFLNRWLMLVQLEIGSVARLSDAARSATWPSLSGLSPSPLQGPKVGASFLEPVQLVLFVVSFATLALALSDELSAALALDSQATAPGRRWHRGILRWTVLLTVLVIADFSLGGRS